MTVQIFLFVSFSCSIRQFTPWGALQRQPKSAPASPALFEEEAIVMYNNLFRMKDRLPLGKKDRH